MLQTSTDSARKEVHDATEEHKAANEVFHQAAIHVQSFPARFTQARLDACLRIARRVRPLTRPRAERSCGLMGGVL